jgi:hypothetical protein
MRTLHSAIVAGIAATAIAGSGAAWAQRADTHIMTVRLPDGGVAQIRCTGNVAPQLRFDAAPAAFSAAAPLPSLFGPGSPFALMDRISAEMDRQAVTMFQQANALAAQAQSGQLTETAMQNLPAGMQGYTFISTMSGNGVCTQSVEITSQGNGAPPRVVRHNSGNCGSSTGSVSLPAAAPSLSQPGPVWTSAPAPAPRPDVVWTSAHGAKPYASLVHEIPPAQR